MVAFSTVSVEESKRSICILGIWRIQGKTSSSLQCPVVVHVRRSEGLHWKPGEDILGLVVIRQWLLLHDPGQFSDHFINFNPDWFTVSRLKSEWEGRLRSPGLIHWLTLQHCWAWFTGGHQNSFLSSTRIALSSKKWAWITGKWVFTHVTVFQIVNNCEKSGISSPMREDHKSPCFSGDIGCFLTVDYMLPQGRAPHRLSDGAEAEMSSITNLWK